MPTERSVRGRSGAFVDAGTPCRMPLGYARVPAALFNLSAGFDLFRQIRDGCRNVLASLASLSGEFVIDAVDRKLLTELQRDAMLTYDQLSERVGASPSAVQRRIAK